MEGGKGGRQAYKVGLFRITCKYGLENSLLLQTTVKILNIGTCMSEQTV